MSTKNTNVKKEDGWVAIETTGSGVLSASKAVQYCKATSQPDDDLLGHHLKTMDCILFELDGDTLYVQTDEIDNVTVISTVG